MSNTIKYLAIAAAAGVGVFVIARRVSNAPKPTGSPLESIVQGLGNLMGSVKPPAASSGSSSSSSSLIHEARIDPGTARARLGSPIGTALGASPVANYAVSTGDGDSAISDGRGMSRSSFLNPQPSGFTSFKERATAGALPSKLYNQNPSRVARA